LHTWQASAIKGTDAEMASLVIERHAFHGEWNYTLQPRRT